MFFILGFVLLIVILITGIETKSEPCKGHKWSYWPDDKMRCDVCKKTPFED
jgi:hypothetical protein